MFTVWFSFTGSKLQTTPYADCTKTYYQYLNRFSANLAMLSDIAMLTLGGDLKRKERISARLGDVLSYLYLASATLKRFNDEGRKQADIPLMQWAVEDCLYKTQQAIDELINNFPNKIISKVLRLTIFPLGCHLSRPSDMTDHQVARILQTPSSARNRLVKGQYITREQENSIGMQEQTLDDILACEPIYDKICQALGKKLPFYYLDKIAEQGLAAEIISQDEANLLIKAEKGRKLSIDVDDFSPEDLPSAKFSTEKNSLKNNNNQIHAA